MTYKRVSYSLLGLITGLLCFVAILFSTSWGAQLSFYFVKKASSVHIEYESGSLLNNLMISQLSIDQEGITVNAEEVHLQLHLRCFWKNQLCIDELSVGSLQVNTKASETPPIDNAVTETPDKSASISLPFSVKMKKFVLAKAQINMQSVNQGVTQATEITLTDFSSALSISKNLSNILALNIEQSKLATADISIANQQTSTTPIVDNANQTWPLAELPELYLPINLTMKPLTINALHVTLSDTNRDKPLQLASENTQLALTWFKSQLAIKTLSSTVKDIGDLGLKGTVTFVPPYLVDIQFTSDITDFEQVPQLNNSQQQVLIQGDLSELITKINSQGELVLKADMLVDVTNQKLPYQLNADVTQFTLPTDMTNVVTPSSLQLNSKGDVNYHTIDLKSNISGFGYQDAVLEFNAIYDKEVFSINTLSFNDATSKNNLNLLGALQLGEHISWDVKVDTTGITLPNIDSRISGRLQGVIHSTGHWNEKEWAIAVTDSVILGEINEIELNAQGNLDINHKGELAQSNLQLNYAGVALNFNGYSDENWHVTGTSEIKQVNALVNDVEGALSANFTVSGPALHPEINLKGKLKNLFVQQISSDAINFEANYHPLDNHKHTVSITSEKINRNSHTIHDIDLSSTGDLNQQQVGVNWQGDSGVNLLLNSDYSPANQRIQISTEQASFSIDKQAFEASETLNFIYNNNQNTLAINKHCWLGSGAQVCLNNNTTIELSKGELAASLKLNSELLAPFIPNDINVSGALDGDIAIAWKPNVMPMINSQLSISEGHIKTTKDETLHSLLEWQGGQLNLHMNNNKVDGSFALYAPDNTEIIKASSVFSLTDNRIEQGNVFINHFSLSPLLVLVPELAILEGGVSTQLTVEGALDNPLINGNIALTKGKAKISGNMNTLDDINLVLDFKGNNAEVTGGLNLNNATATLTGNANWQSELKGEFNLDGESLSFSVPPDLTLTLSPHLNAQIQASALKLSGNVEILDGKLTIDKLPQGSVSLSKDVIIVNDDGEKVVSEKPFDVSTNIRVIIADAFKVEGQGFTGRLGGDLQVSQQPQQPLQLFGNLKVPQGRYKAYGQDLSITKGNITFNGPTNNPYVAMQATRTIEKENIVVGIDATGLTNSLDIKLFSNPTMQQSETLSYLVRGRGLDAETGDSNTAIGVALGTAITNFSGVLDQIEKLPLINRVEIDGDEKQATIAGYLGDKVYIKYGLGIMEPINELTVRFYLLNRLWVETVSGLENSADIYYSFDIK
ncbi:translocation/assembly module TamB domain-containing protein [Thalassotalea profundi]|uniref:DUF490 domain-containing protein n=1 Tax=Thalassotalea profundi TaxID=2036687 RepID=A0ABQ3J2S2_9GAMM|nr:translocation/assembly module TamB domain-containing protein [Thalassotalea profundi]GHF02371.1 DUF490 domain-containing protein [Thalassotalea profundi]